MSFAISIAHAAHREGRRDSLNRLLHLLGLSSAHRVVVCAEPGKPSEWSDKQWAGASLLAEQYGLTHAMLLNDDMVPCEGFMAAAERLIEARPNHIVNLYNTHPLAKKAKADGLSWITSADGLIGNAYILPIAGLRAFREWRASSLKGGTVDELSEDQLINLWAMQQGALIWHTVPALMNHDTTVPSCFGNTQLRRPAVRATGDASGIDWGTDAMHVGRVFNGNHKALLTHVLGDRLPLVKRYYELAGDESR